MHLTSRSRGTGFTLIEMAVTTVLLVILLGLGVPSFIDLIGRSRVTNAANALVGHLQFARSEAIKRGRNRVGVGANTSADAWVTGSADWTGGYFVALIDNSSPPTILQVLRRIDGAELQNLMMWSNASPPRVYFNPDGTSPTSGTVIICNQSQEQRRTVVVDNLGRIRAATTLPGGATPACRPD